MKKPEPAFRRLSEYEPKKINWFWDQLIPFGMTTVVEGDPGLGKSYLLMHLAALLTKGATLPTGQHIRPRDVVYCTTEDSYNYTFSPRIKALGGDHTRIWVQGKYSAMDDDGLRTLKSLVKRRKPGLIVVDPLFSYVPVERNAYSPNEIRAIMGELNEIGESSNAAVLLILHLTKTKRDKQIYQGAGKGAYLMRSGESLVPMTEDRLRTIFAEGGPDWLDEPTKTGLDAQDVVDLLDTQTFFDLLKLPYPSNREGVLERLRSENLIDAGDGRFSIRRCGGILLAKRLAEFPELARKAARVVVYSGSNKLETRIDQIGERGYAVDFQGLVGFVVSQLPQNEVVKDALRQSVTLLPDEAIRELIANALIHQDFTATGAGPMVEIYSNRVEISNPGEPIVPVDRFIDGYQSRNERLTDLMRRMDICEERSSGVDRVVHAAEIYQLPAPEFRSDLGRTTVVVHGIRSFEEMTRDDRVRACYQHCVLKWVTSERMTNETLRNRFGLGPAKASVVSQIITAAVEAGWIKSDESVGASRKYARYLPNWA